MNTEVLAGEFVLAGHEVRVVTWSKLGEADHFAFGVVRAPSATRLLQEHRWAEVVYENNICLRLSWPAMLIGNPSVVALRTWVRRLDGSVGVQDRLKLIWLKRAKGVIAVSQAVRKKCWPDAITIGNPYRNEMFKIRPHINRDRDFAFLGRLVSDKGADMAIQALQLLNADDGLNPLSLTVIGDGPERQALECLAVELGVSKQVSFTGALRGDDLVEMLNRHRFIWVPSRWEEPFGNVALEGMACGCVPIVSDGGGLPDAVGDAGLVCKRGDLCDLVDQSKRLLNDSELHQRLMDAAIDHLESHKPQHVASRYLEVIEAAIAE